MADNPNRARRELRQSFQRVSMLHDKINGLLDELYGETEHTVEAHEKWIREHLSVIWRKRIEYRVKKQEQDAYEARRNGVLRLRKMPVGCDERVHWYKTGDGRTSEEERGRSLHTKYFLSLSSSQRRRRFTYDRTF